MQSVPVDQVADRTAQYEPQSNFVYAVVQKIESGLKNQSKDQNQDSPESSDDRQNSVITVKNTEGGAGILGIDQAEEAIFGHRLTWIEMGLYPPFA